MLINFFKSYHIIKIASSITYVKKKKSKILKKKIKKKIFKRKEDVYSQKPQSIPIKYPISILTFKSKTWPTYSSTRPIFSTPSPRFQLSLQFQTHPHICTDVDLQRSTVIIETNSRQSINYSHRPLNYNHVRNVFISLVVILRRR